MLAVAIFVLGVYRAVEIGRALVTRVYQSRAYWIGAVMTLLIISNVTSLFSASVANLISNVTFISIFVVLLLFVDSNVSVAREIDFFHMDILNWQRVRRPLLVVALVSTALIGGAAALTGNSYSEWWAAVVLVEYFTVLGVALTYSALTMAAIARRTYDSTMRRFVRNLAFGIVGMALFVTLWLPFDEVYPMLGDVITDYILIGAAYFFYRATMSLTPVGKLETVAGTAPGPK